MTTLIIGGGLSGLALADLLERAGRYYILLEARDRFGGRMMTQTQGSGYFDMGPAWFWPGQPRIAQIVARFGLTRFEQFSDGLICFEDDRGHVQRGKGFASMAGSWRLDGGFDRLTQAIADTIPAGRKRLNAHVTSIAKTPDGVGVTLADGDQITGADVALCLPPRLAAGISFTPALPDAALVELRDVSTWMAGQGKAVAVYDTAFWRDAGLSGDAISRKGPIAEFHDASPASGGPYALFGFIGIPPAHRRDEQALRQMILAQLGRMFGPEAAEPLSLYLKDWAFDPFTATVADQAPLYAHPTYRLPPHARDLWDGALHFGGTEVAPEFGGYIEGALEAPENVFARLNGS